MKERKKLVCDAPHRTLKCNGFESEPNTINSSNRKQYSLSTDLVIFFFRSFRKHRRAHEKKKTIFFFPSPYPLALGVFLITRARRTLKKKIEGLWTGYKQYRHAAMCGVVQYHLLPEYLIKANLISTCIPYERKTSSCLTQIEDTLEFPYTRWGGGEGRGGGWGSHFPHTFS